MYISPALYHLPRAQDGLPICLMVGETQCGTVQTGLFYLSFCQFIPGAVIFLRRPEGMSLREMQAEKRLAKPERGLRTGIPLHQRGELPVKSKRWHAFVQKILSSKELHQGAGGNPPCPPRLRLASLHHQVTGKGAGGGIAVNVAASPHIRPTVPVKEIPVGLHQFIGVFLKFPCDIGLVLISVPEVPDGSIHIEGPTGIIIKRMAVPVPSVPGIIVQDCLGMVPHHVFPDWIPLHMQKRHVQHIEQTPVLRHGVRMGIPLQEPGDCILFFFCISIPNLCPAFPQTDCQSRSLHRLLKCPERIRMPADALLILISSHIQRISLGAHAENLALIIFRYGITAYLQVRNVGD